MKNLLLILNPVAGKGKGKSALFAMIDIFTKHGFRVSVMPTSPNGTEARVIKEVANYDLVVAVGGDGTLNIVASAIIKSGCDVPMGYIPLGSTNDFGYSLGLPKTIAQICHRIARGTPKYIDIGKFDDKYFVYIACTGLFTNVSYTTSQRMKNALGHSAYIIKGIHELLDYHWNSYRIQLEDETITGDFVYAGVSNSLRAGGFFTLPKGSVSFNDGLFEITLIKRPKNLAEKVKLINDILNSHINSPYFVHKKVSKAVFACEQTKGWSLDGENGGERRKVSFEVLKNKLKFIY